MVPEGCSVTNTLTPSDYSCTHGELAKPLSNSAKSEHYSEFDSDTSSTCEKGGGFNALVHSESLSDPAKRINYS